MGFPIIVLESEMMRDKTPAEKVAQTKAMRQRQQEPGICKLAWKWLNEETIMGMDAGSALQRGWKRLNEPVLGTDRRREFREKAEYAARDLDTDIENIRAGYINRPHHTERVLRELSGMKPEFKKLVLSRLKPANLETLMEMEKAGSGNCAGQAENTAADAQLRKE